MESEYSSTAAAASVDSVHSRRCPLLDPIRPARHLNGVKLDDYGVVSIAQPPIKDQTDFGWNLKLLSVNQIGERVCHTFHRSLAPYCQLNPRIIPRIQQSCSRLPL